MLSKSLQRYTSSLFVLKRFSRAFNSAAGKGASEAAEEIEITQGLFK
jgi:hypothetical protein